MLVITATRQYQSASTLSTNGKKFSTQTTKQRGTLEQNTSFQQSCNVTFAKPHAELHFSMNQIMTKFIMFID